jgi:hypothetical protein
MYIYKDDTGRMFSKGFDPFRQDNIDGRITLKQILQECFNFR